MQKTILTLVVIAGLNALVWAEPMSLKILWDIPTGEVKAKTIRAYHEENIRVEEVFYFSRSYKRLPVKIFGYFCYPRTSSKRLPALLVSHGGGGTASLYRSVNWAKKGYAVLSIDLPGKGENRRASRSTGPEMTVKNLLRTQPDLSYNYLIHAVAAARNGITYLTQRKEVDPRRIGMIGLSWGGVITLLTNGQDQRLKAAVNVFGAGYIPEGCTWEKWFARMSAAERNLWNNYLDPKNFLNTQHAPILFISGTNDHCYYLPTFQKSYREVKTEKSYYLIPNLRHRFLSSGELPALAWLGQKLKWGGSFPKITSLPPTQETEESILIPIEIRSEKEVKSVTLYYAAEGPYQWTIKKWQEVFPVRKEGNIIYFSLPIALLRPEVLYFSSIRDVCGGRASTPVFSLFAVILKNGTKTYAMSSPLVNTYQHEGPFNLVGQNQNKDLYLYYLKEVRIFKEFYRNGFSFLKSGRYTSLLSSS